MIVNEARIEYFLSAIKSNGRSSPAGMHWQQFHEFLTTQTQPGHGKPPVPLILAAAGESARSKQSRLSRQLVWALENGCLEQAIRYLEDMPLDWWDSCGLERWDQDAY